MTLAAKLGELLVRTDLDDRDESVDKRVREAELNWIPYIVVVGKREATTDQLAIRRRRDGKQYNSSLADLEKEIAELTKGYPRMPLRLPVMLSKRPGYKQL
jgi:threonyl-tRNA synthetase